MTLIRQVDQVGRKPYTPVVGDVIENILGKRHLILETDHYFVGSYEMVDGHLEQSEHSACCWCIWKSYVRDCLIICKGDHRYLAVEVP